MSRGLYHKFTPEERRKWDETHPVEQRYKNALVRVATVLYNSRVFPELQGLSLHDIKPGALTPEMITAAIEYCLTRIRDFATRRENHRTRVAIKFYSKWVEILERGDFYPPVERRLESFVGRQNTGYSLAEIASVYLRSGVATSEEIAKMRLSDDVGLIHLHERVAGEEIGFWTAVVKCRTCDNVVRSQTPGVQCYTCAGNI